MVNAVMVLVIAIVLLVFAYRMKVSLKNEKLQRYTYQQTYATIDRVIFSDGGNVRYYVSFYENDSKITAQTDYYSSETKSLNPNDEVKIGYYFNKKGRALAVIFDERVIPVSDRVSGFITFLATIGIALLLLAVGMFARLMFFQ